MRVHPHVGDGAVGADPTNTADLSVASASVGPTTHAAGMAGMSALTANAVADGAVETWESVAAALAPIIGPSAVTALYRRCLVSAGDKRAWLPPVTAADSPANDWPALHACLSRRTAIEAAEACTSLFVTFRDLLGSLLGPSLTEQLLRPVSAHPPTGSAVQDIP